MNWHANNFAVPQSSLTTIFYGTFDTVVDSIVWRKLPKISNNYILEMTTKRLRNDSQGNVIFSDIKFSVRSCMGKGEEREISHENDLRWTLLIQLSYFPLWTGIEYPDTRYLNWLWGYEVICCSLKVILRTLEICNKISLSIVLLRFSERWPLKWTAGGYLKEISFARFRSIPNQNYIWNLLDHFSSNWFVYLTDSLIYLCFNVNIQKRLVPSILAIKLIEINWNFLIASAI